MVAGSGTVGIQEFIWHLGKRSGRIRRECALPIQEEKEYFIKIRIYLLALMLLFVCLQSVHAQEYGKIRALRQRAEHVIKQKNDFVVRVLTAYTIPHERNAQGIVVHINVDGQWLAVTAIEIVPVLKEEADKHPQVVAHNLLFYTADGILDLVSDLTIR
jgi:hypothetical protein